MARKFDVVKYINAHTDYDGKCRLRYNTFFFNYLNNADPKRITDREKEALEKVVEINWSVSGITQLPKNLKVLTRLTKLNLNRNQITDINPLRGLTSLTVLFLYNNQITDISPLSGLTSLTELNLRRNQITDINSLSGLTSLTELGLYNNQITDINPLRELTRLTELDLCENLITDINPLSGLTSLTELDLDGNQITDISPLSKLKSLTKLDLSSLNLKSIPDSLIKIALDNGLEFYDDNYHEKGINLFGTTLSEQDISMFFNREALNEYIKAKEKVATNEVKVIFLGNGGAGKTHTVRRLLNGGEDVDAVQDETIGIQISNYQTKTKDGADMTLRIWDFGGQNYMHSMHRCFLTSNTIYVVVLYGREGNLTSNAVSWLENIKSFAPKSDVIIAVNLWEGEVKPGINTEKLRENYGDIYVDTVEYYAHMLNKDDEETVSANVRSFEVLTNAINRRAEIMCKTQTSKAMAEVKKRITEEFETKSFISKEDYLKICDEVSENLQAEDKIDEKTACVFLSYFNDTGISVSRIKKDSSGNTVGVEDDTYTVLNPDWLFKGIYRIIATQKTLIENAVNAVENAEQGTEEYTGKETVKGKVNVQSIVENINEPAEAVLKRKDENGQPIKIKISIPEITDDNKKYNEKQCKAILAIMRQYNMSKSIDRYTEFIPAVCSDEKPKLLKCNEKSEDGTPIYKDAVCLEYRYAYLPSTVIQKLMLTVKFDNIYNAWQNGAEFSYGNNLVLAETDGIKNTLSLKIYKKDENDSAYNTMYFLHTAINNINNDLHIAARSYLVVPSKLSTDRDKKTASFSIAGLLAAVKNGDMVIPYFDNDNYETYNLYDLLGKLFIREETQCIEKAFHKRDIEAIKQILSKLVPQINIDKLVWGNDQSITQSGNNNNMAGRDVILNSHNKTEIHEGISDISEIVKTLAKCHEQVEEQTLNTMLEIIKSDKELSAKVTAVPNIESADKESKFDLIMDILLDAANVFEKPLSPVQWIKSTKGVVNKLKTLFPEHPNP